MYAHDTAGPVHLSFGAEEIENARALAFGPDGLLYVLDIGDVGVDDDSRIVSFDQDGDYQGEFALVAPAVENTLAIGPEGWLYTADGESGGDVYDIYTGAHLGDFGTTRGENPIPGKPWLLRHGDYLYLYDTDHFVHVFLAAAPLPCPLGQAYWKGKKTPWPVTSLVLGDKTYKRNEAERLLSPKGPGATGDASAVLAGALVAAKLNIARGSDPAPIAATIADADAALSGFKPKLPFKVKPTTTLGQRMLADAALLEAYNNGAFTTGCTP